MPRFRYATPLLPLLILLLSGACRTRSPTHTRTWNAHTAGLDWLKAQQGPDGFWGEGDEKRILTSFVVLANEQELTIMLWALEQASIMTGNPLLERELPALRAALPEHPTVFWRAMLEDGATFRNAYPPPTLLELWPIQFMHWTAL